MAKTCGRERYASEVVEDGMVWAVARRADVPSALLRGLETSRAASASGVLAVLTASDVKGTNLLGILEPGAPLLHEGREGNLASSGFVRRGDVEPLLASCDHVAEETFRFAAQEHAYLETEGGVARYGGQILTMEVSTQSPWRDRDELSRALRRAFSARPSVTVP